MADEKRRRTWAGSTMEERKAARREQLLAAARDLMATPGGVSVRAVCRAAQLTERYFYESFPDRDSLVVATYERASREAFEAVAAAVAATDGSAEAVARAAVSVVVEQTIDDPARGHVLIVAPLTNPLLFDKREELLPLLTGLISAQLPAKTPQAMRELAAIGLSGALAQLFHAYLTGKVEVAREDFIEHCVMFLMNVGPLRPVRGGR